MMKKKIIVTLLILGSIVAACGKKANPELQIENYQPVEEFQSAYEALKERKADIKPNQRKRKGPAFEALQIMQPA